MQRAHIMNRYDALELRCPRLGGEVRFSYCRKEGGNLPCARIIACWQTFFPVAEYLQGTMDKESWDAFVGQAPKDKITTLMELIEAAKKHTEEDQ